VKDYLIFGTKNTFRSVIKSGNF